MEKNEAIELMKTSATIEEWNANRETVKERCPEAINEIDTSGMVHETLESQQSQSTSGSTGNRNQAYLKRADCPKRPNGRLCQTKNPIIMAAKKLQNIDAIGDLWWNGIVKCGYCGKNFRSLDTDVGPKKIKPDPITLMSPHCCKECRNKTE